VVAACVTVNVWPAMVMVPERAAPVFAATLYATVPLPVLLVPDVIVIHEALLDAVQAHVDPALTATEPVPPAADAGAVGEAIEYVHVGAGVAAACVTVNVCPAIVSVPVRVPLVLAATV
jgi:hypothetical protein